MADELRDTAIALIKNMIHVKDSEDVLCVDVSDIKNLAKAVGYCEAEHNPERIIRVIGFEEVSLRALVRKFMDATMNMNGESIAAAHDEAKRLGL